MKEETLKRIGNWLVEGDTGKSSKSLCAIYLGGNTKEISTPLDFSDFDRCIKFLHKLGAEEVNLLLKKIAKQNKTWAIIAKEWTDLLFLYNKQDYVGLSKRLEEIYEPKDNEILLP